MLRQARLITRLGVMSLAAGLTAACGNHLPDTPAGYVARYGIADPAPASFKYCFGHGCRESAQVSLHGGPWREIRDLLSEPAPDAAAERRLLSRAVAVYERHASAQAGTQDDGGIDGWFVNGHRPGQLDCVDEAVNTTTFLLMLREAGLLRWHDVAGPAVRGHLIGRWPHQTAVIVERAGGGTYALDSWFYENAVPAAVVPLTVWRDGWSPGDPLPSAAAGPYPPSAASTKSSRS